MKVKLTDICSPKQWRTIPNEQLTEDGYPVYGANGIIGKYPEYNHEAPVIAITCRGATCGNINVTQEKAYVTGNAMCLDNLRSDVDLEYLFYALRHYDFSTVISGSAQSQITRQRLGKVSIHLHPLEQQKFIAKMLARAERIIAHRHSQLAKLDELVECRFVEMFGDTELNPYSFPVEKLGNLCCVGSSKRIYQNEQSAEGIPFLRISDLVARIDQGIESCKIYIPFEKYKELSGCNLVPGAGDILITSRGTLGKCYIVKETDKFYFQDGMISWLSEISEKLTSQYISHLFSMRSMHKQMKNLQAGSTVAYLSIAMLKKLDIMVPPLELQYAFSDCVQRVGILRSAIQRSMEETQKLFDSLMQKHFD